jgi:lipoate-protein ligase A
MAADTFLLDHAQQPTLRLYAWERPCLSLGYAQRWSREVPVELVRRPSGGRAVLHHHEITYAIALPQYCGSLSQVYHQLTALWLQTLRPIDPRVSQQEQNQPSLAHPSCYQLTQRGEICLAGQKWIGSAQVRRAGRLLQHGSIPTGIDKTLFEALLPGSRPPAFLPQLTWQRLVEAFPIPLQRQDWRPEELAAITPGKAGTRGEPMQPSCPS